MRRISGQALSCAERAEQCAEQAKNITYDAITRRDFSDMAQRWAALAQSYTLAEEISGYIEWQARRVDPPV